MYTEAIPTALNYGTGIIFDMPFGIAKGNHVVLLVGPAILSVMCSL